ncbi:hypothetical protein [Erythrobacter sp. F6033]|uniref:helix-turn-helix transcriptional regulator n=1 Tax=Erythrobacter sp. F6033 TaxID=2926401 RepID=UPI001FF66C6D|nr:hypothetical protein [Erythrobacter sp. F6033]MCK0127342.1 hypothetical protein [Erythrobacter sp. F6033]
MPPEAARPLTERQQAVIERIDRRMPIKVIAQELGVSETRINQHIRALKDIYSAGSLGELVEIYRASKTQEQSAIPPEVVTGAPSIGDGHKGFTESVYSKNQVPQPTQPSDIGNRVDRGELVMSDAFPLIEQAPWLRPDEPKVVPGVLDGEHAVLFRLAAIVGIVFGMMAAVALSVTAAVALSEAMDGSERVPVSEIQPTV